MTTPPRLDRLSAILAGLAPRIEVVRPEFGVPEINFAASKRPVLYLHLLAEGQIRMQVPRQACEAVSAPALIVCRGNVTHSLSAASPTASGVLMCARACLDGPVANLFLEEFRRPQVISLDSADSSLGHVIRLISSELGEPRCGQPALLDRAGDILFIGVLRHLVAHPLTTGGLFNGLADPRIARALVAMHAAPQDPWTLATLAEEAGMSRTSFAIRFREVVRQPPGKYLGTLRLSIARRVVQSGRGLKLAARDSGYRSTSALSRALSRARP